MFKKIIFFFLLITTHGITPAPTCSITPIDTNTHQLNVTFDIEPGNCLYHDYLSFSTDHPGITLSQHTASIEPQQHYDATFKTNKRGYFKPVTFQLTAHTDNPAIDNAHVHVSYYEKNAPSIEHASFDLAFHTNTPKSDTIDESPNEQPTMHSHTIKNAPQEHKKVQTSSWSSQLSHTLKTTESLIVRLLLALLLGLLLSLTPCVYPMIPITIGVLQAQGTKSIGRNFAMALFYVLGIATTFASLGLLAAFTGQLFGNLLTKPLFIGSIVALLVYLAGSMMGLYEMWIPRFLQNNGSNNHSGSLISAFAFGAVSGSVASPCLSPGLLLLLTLVTTLGSKLLGFLLLFSFGVGLGIPLLVIGTFSSSMSAMPRAGMWMVEIKKAFGWLIMATALYFLNNIMPWFATMWIATTLIFCAGLFYLHESKKSRDRWKTFHTLLGMLLISASVFAAAKSYQAMHQTNKAASYGNWIDSYERALERAKQEHKLVFLDVSAPYCSICKAIDGTLFCCEDVQQKLDDYVAVKLDDIDPDIAQQFNVVGVPTFIVIDPHTQQEIARWGAELYDVHASEFVAQLDRNNADK